MRIAAMYRPRTPSTGVCDRCVSWATSLHRVTNGTTTNGVLKEKVRPFGQSALFSVSLAVSGADSLPSGGLPRAGVYPIPFGGSNYNNGKREATLGTRHAFMKLPQRSVLCVEGKDAAHLLQGLVTNDLDNFLQHDKHTGGGSSSTRGKRKRIVAMARKDVVEEEQVTPDDSDRSTELFGAGGSIGDCAMYSGFLQVSGRVLAEGTIVRSDSPCKFLVECDASLVHAVRKHVRRYQLRSKVKVRDMSRSLGVHCVLTANWKRQSFMQQLLESLCASLPHREEETASNTPSTERTSEDGGERSYVFIDPRHPVMGIRAFLPRKVELQSCLPEDFVEVDEGFYHAHRILNNVPEGCWEILSKDALPLESNFDELNAISYSKGCYLGQELTSRVHYTGVVRKRLLPVVAASTPEEARALARSVRDQLLNTYEGTRGGESFDTAEKTKGEERKADGVASTNALGAPLLPEGLFQRRGKNCTADGEDHSFPRGQSSLIPGSTLVPLDPSAQQHQEETLQKRTRRRRRSNRGAGRVVGAVGPIGMALLRLDSANAALSVLPPTTTPASDDSPGKAADEPKGRGGSLETQTQQKSSETTAAGPALLQTARAYACPIWPPVSVPIANGKEAGGKAEE